MKKKTAMVDGSSIFCDEVAVIWRAMKCTLKNYVAFSGSGGTLVVDVEFAKTR